MNKSDAQHQRLKQLLGVMQRDHKPLQWTFDGEHLNVIDFANKVWPVDCADKTAFLLKYST